MLITTCGNFLYNVISSKHGGYSGNVVFHPLKTSIFLYEVLLMCD